MKNLIRAVLAAITLCLAAAPALHAQILVFAAASLKGALEEVASQWQDQTGSTVTISYAGSAALARQIAQGAPAQIFISANPDWMDVLEGNSLIAPETRVDLLGNRLVLIGGKTARPMAFTPDIDLRGALGDGHLALGQVDAVPAGIYAKAALQSYGLWAGIKDRVVQAENVRVALAYVATGATPLGIVYRSDARAEPRVEILDEIPAGMHPPIIYPAAIIRGGDGPEARSFLAFLQSAEAKAIFALAGFDPKD